MFIHYLRSLATYEVTLLATFSHHLHVFSLFMKSPVITTIVSGSPQHSFAICFPESTVLEGSFPFGIPSSSVAPNFHHFLGILENEEGYMGWHGCCTEDVSVRTPNLKKLEICGVQFNRDLLVKKASVVEEGSMVGFDKEAEILVERLKGGMSELEIVSIIGMSDIDYSGNEVFIGILSYVEKLADEMFKWSDERLAEEMCLHLQTKRYIIVMDDMWIRGPWDDLIMAFPKNNNRSRILLTIRNREVALHDNPYNLPHFLRFLYNDGSWEPLERVFRKESCPPELEVLGKQIAK
ncbi:hypothetical protein U1Q18_001960 [Sarracenia purpurea var. burkii]